MKHTGIALILISSAAILAGCIADADDGGNGEPATTTTPTATKPNIAMTVKPAPTQPRNARRPVGFDPCFEIGDPTITQAGFAPETRERTDQIHDGYAFISCRFDRREDVRGQVLRVGSLTVSSTNLTLDEFRGREGTAATNIKVSDRDAIAYVRSAEEACYIVMTGPDGTIDVRVSSTLALTQWRACDHAQEIAGVIESALPER